MILPLNSDFERSLGSVIKPGLILLNKFGQQIYASFQPFFNLIPPFRNFKKNALPTDQRTDGRTEPLIEIYDL